MKLFRDPDMKMYAAVYVVILAAVLLLFAKDLRMAAGLCVLAGACALIHFWNIKRRNDIVSEMTRELDELLHEGKHLDIARYREGELSLLADEIGKMTVRLEEQADRLLQDKKYLADSIADISHQIRTPLASMYLHLEAAGQCEGQEEERNSHLRELRRQQDRIEWLISSLLKMARLDAGTIVMKKEEIPLMELMKKAIAPLEILMELKEQRMIWDVEGSVFADAAWTEEAIRNVMKNCVEHMDAGTLYLTAKENPIYSEIVIRDTGTGIDKEDLPHLFERFYKGKNANTQSAGIGLALSRTILANQGATIRVQNHPEGGAVFEIRFYKNMVS